MATPDTLGGSSLAAWFKADAITGFTDGAALTSWVDSSGHANTLNNVSGAAPKYRATGGPLGLPCVDHTIAVGGINRSNVVSGMATGDYTYFMVVQSGSTAIQSLMQGGVNTAQIRLNNLKVELDKAGVVAIKTSTTGLTSNTWTIVIATYTSVGSVVHFDIGGTTENYSVGGTTTFSNSGLFYGNYQITYNRFNGKMAEIGFYSSVLSSGDLTDLKAYLIAKWVTGSILTTTTGLSPIEVATSSAASLLVHTNGSAPVSNESSNHTYMLGTGQGLAPVHVPSTSFTRRLYHTKGLSPYRLQSTSKATLVGPARTTGYAAVSVYSSGIAITISATTGLSPVGISSSGGRAVFTYTDIESYVGEDSDVLIPIRLTGRLQPYLPEPVPPVDFAGIPDPTVAPICVASDTLNGHLLDGTYRYSYAAWVGYIGQMTAPSPWSEEVSLTTDDTVTLTYPVIVGADGYIVYRWKVI